MKTAWTACAAAVALGAWLALAPPAAGVIFEVTPVTATVAPDSSFEIAFTVDTQGAALVAYEFALAVTGPGSGLFEVTGRRTAGSPFSDVVPGTLAPSDVLDPESTQMFGGSVPNVYVPADPGTGLFLSAFTIHASDLLTPGTYTIAMANWQVVYGDFSAESGTAGPGVAVTVPEPGCLALLLVAPLILRRSRRRC